MLKSVEARIAALEEQTAPVEDGPSIIFLVGMPVGDMQVEAFRASTGHIRRDDETEAQFRARIAADVGDPRKPQLVGLECRPVERKHAE